MKYVLAMMVAALIAGNAAMAHEESAEKSVDVDSSKNPITGTVTTKKKMKSKHKDMAGNMHSKTTTETTKMKKDGVVEKKTETEHTDEHGH